MLQGNSHLIQELINMIFRNKTFSTSQSQSHNQARLQMWSTEIAPQPILAPSMVFRNFLHWCSSLRISPSNLMHLFISMLHRFLHYSLYLYTGKMYLNILHTYTYTWLWIWARCIQSKM